MRVATFSGGTPRRLFGDFPESDSNISVIRKLYEHFSFPFSRQISVPKTEFQILAQEWKTSTAHLSSITEISIHPAYQRIIGMGEKAVPFILQEMADTPYHWFWALKAITGEDPVPPEHRGRIKLMTEDWLAWGRGKGYIQ